MKARFIGDPRDNFSGPAIMEAFGMKFPRGEWVDVVGENETMKLRNNFHFECELATDGSMIADGVKKQDDDEKHELIVIAESLGIDVDGRWGVARLRQEIAAKEAAKEQP